MNAKQCSYQTTGFHSVAFRSCEFRGTFRSQFWNAQIPLKWYDTGMQKIAGHPAKFHSTGFLQILAGIRGALIRPCHLLYHSMNFSHPLVATSQCMYISTAVLSVLNKYNPALFNKAASCLCCGVYTLHLYLEKQHPIMMIARQIQSLINSLKMQISVN